MLGAADAEAAGVLACMTSEACGACREVRASRELERAAAAVRESGARVVNVHFSNLAAATISAAEEVVFSPRGIPRREEMPAARVPEASALRSYCARFPMWISVPRGEWDRACARRPGALSPGAPDMRAEAPGWRTVARAFGDSGTREWALVAEDPERNCFEAAAAVRHKAPGGGETSERYVAAPRPRRR